MDAVEPGREGRVDLSHAGVPEVEGDLPHGDEVVQTRGVDLPVLPVAVQQCVPERLVPLLVPQLPQGDGELVQPWPGAAVVEVDELDLAAMEQGVAEVQVGVDEPGVVDVVEVSHPGGHRLEAGAYLRREERPAAGGGRLAVDHHVTEERLAVPPDADEVGGRRPRVGLVVEQGHRPAEPAQVHGPRGPLHDAAVHPAEQRADPGLSGGGRLDGRGAVRGQECLGDRQVRPGPDRTEPGDLRADRRRRVDVPAVPVGSVHPDEVPPGAAVVTERGVLPVRHEREPADRQRVVVQRGHRHPPHPRDLRAPRRHRPLGSTAHGRSTSPSSGVGRSAPGLPASA